MQEIINKAEEFALSEIEKYDLPSKLNFETANQQAEVLLKNYDIDPDVVRIGVRLMDIKLGEAASLGKIKEHVEMCITTTKEFLEQFDLPQETKDKIINCVAGHHKTAPWICKEAEICANADCYRFLLPKNWLAFLSSLAKRETTLEENIAYAQAKADEKWNILTLEECKKELEPHYKLIKEMIAQAR